LVLLGAAAGFSDRVAAVARPRPLLVRPDGVVAWDGTGSLDRALRRWCGVASVATAS
jgi:hypothetical protein